MACPPKIILASKSPRRAALLHQIGFMFQVLTEEVSEDGITTSDPVKHVLELSKRKAEAVLNRIAEGLIIGADTIVFIEGEILGKPKNEKEAKFMLMRLSGKTHEVFTGFTLIQIGGKRFSDIERTAVTFRKLDEWEVDEYVKTGSPMDKAGAYGIQDQSGLFVNRIDGCFYNVVGFPLAKFYEGLKRIFDIDTIQRICCRV